MKVFSSNTGRGANVRIQTFGIYDIYIKPPSSVFEDIHQRYPSQTDNTTVRNGSVMKVLHGLICKLTSSSLPVPGTSLKSHDYSI